MTDAARHSSVSKNAAVQNPAYRPTAFFFNRAHRAVSLNEIKKSTNQLQRASLLFGMTHLENDMKEKIRQLVNFFTRSLWRVTESDVSRGRYTSYNLMKIIIQTVKCFIRDRVWIRAAALSYTTLFSDRKSTRLNSSH